MAIKTRNELKKAFQRGSIPTQEDFANLIDSLSHIEEDGWFNREYGWKISPSGISNKMISFLKNMTEKSPIWTLEQHKLDDENCGLNLINSYGESNFYLNYNGNIGIGTIEPKGKLDVNGEIYCQGRKGTYCYGSVPGDGEWHQIITNLKDCHVFEIVAKINKYKKGIHSIIYAIAVNAFNGYRKDINKITAYYKSYRDQIDLRWTGEDFNYNLEIRTRKDQHNNCDIEYNISKLF